MKRTNESGQTIIALLIFMLVAMTITLAAIAVAITNIQSNNSFVKGEIALQNATSGMEDAIIQLERNPSYSGGTSTFDQGTATITVSGSGSFTLVSVGVDGNNQRTITVNATETADSISATNWSETP